MYVPDERVATFAQYLKSFFGVRTKEFAHLIGVRYLIHTDVNHGRARFDVFASNHPRPANRDDQEIRFASHGSEVARTRVANSHGSVALQKQLGHGTPDNLAATDESGASAASVAGAVKPTIGAPTG